MSDRYIYLTDFFYAVLDTKTNLIWNYHNSAPLTFKQAQLYIKRYALEQETNWRMPTFKELNGLREITNSQSFITNSIFLPRSASIWSSSLNEYSSTSYNRLIFKNSIYDHYLEVDVEAEHVRHAVKMVCNA